MSKIQTNQLQHTANGAAVFTLPTADGSADEVLKTNGSGTLAFTAISAGITEVDQYRLSSNVTSSGNNAVINVWERTDTSIHAANASPHGTGMSYSSGIFTFPSTGKYFVLLSMKCSCGVDDNVQIYHQVTTNNNTYTAIAGSTDGQNGGSGIRNGSGASFCFIDVTNTTNVKIRFYADSIGSNSHLQGGTNESTEVIFIRIADT